MPGPEREVTRQDVLNVMRTREDHRNPWVVKELMTELDAGQTVVYDRLRELHALGEVRTKEVGARARVWWLVNPPLEPTTRAMPDSV